MIPYQITMIRLTFLLSCLLHLLSPALPGISQGAERPNVLLICVDDLRPELRSFGVDHILSPNIDRLAETGRAFHRHYVQAPTCGASRYTLLTGRYGGADNGALFQRGNALSKDPSAFPPSLPGWFRQNGYSTVSVGKVSHHPGGWGGSDWNDLDILEMPDAWDSRFLPAGAWLHPRGWMHGLANGEIRFRAEDMDVFQSTPGPDCIYPDGPNTETAMEQLTQLAKDKKPFFLAFGILRPHLPLGAPAKYMEPYKNIELPAIPHPNKPEGRTTWHGSGEFYKYNRWGKDPNKDSEFADEVRKHYAACVSFADAQVGRILDRLDQLKLSDNTIVVLWGDHGWHLGERAIWGKHALFEESLRSPLIIRYPGMPNPGSSSQAVVETLDIFPTLAELAGLPQPDFVHGSTLTPQLKCPEAAGHPAVSYTGGAKTIRTESYRLIEHRDGYLELYDHSSPEGESNNVASSHPKLTESLLSQLNSKMNAN